MMLFTFRAATLEQARDLADTTDALRFLPPETGDDEPESAPPRPSQPQAESPVKRVRVSPGVGMAFVLEKAEPEYPAEARDAGVEGDVVLHVIVGRDGAVAEVEVLSGHPLLTDAALEAVRRWKFRPYELDGAPAEMDTRIAVRFSLLAAKQKS